jgi:hypothetical protein
VFTRNYHWSILSQRNPVHIYVYLSSLNFFVFNAFHARNVMYNKKKALLGKSNERERECDMRERERINAMRIFVVA